MWQLIADASQAPLQVLSVPLDAMTQQIDRESTAKSILHQLDMAMREVVGNEIKTRSQQQHGRDLMRQGLGKHLSRVKRDVLARWRGELDTSSTIMSSSNIIDACTREVVDQCDVFAWNALHVLPIECERDDIIEHIQLEAHAMHSNCMCSMISSLSHSNIVNIVFGGHRKERKQSQHHFFRNFFHHYYQF